MTAVVAATELLDLPETGGLDDEIGGHVPVDVAIETVACPRCGDAVGEQAIGHVCDGEYRDHPQGAPGEVA